MTSLYYLRTLILVPTDLKLTPHTMHRQAYGRVALIIAVCLLPFSLARLALFLIYREDFQSMGLMDILSAFVQGLRFDLSVTLIGILLPLLFMLLPFRWSHHAYWQRLWGWMIYIVLLLLIFMLTVDTIYFGIVHRHAGSEINTIAADMAPMLALAIGQYGAILLLYVIGALFGALLWWRLIQPIPALPQRVWTRLLGVAVIFFLFVLLARGGWSRKPINVSDAFYSNSISQGYLTLNGAFAITHALNDGTPPLHEYMPQFEAVARTQHILEGSSEPFKMSDYPIYRQTKAVVHGQKPNVVVLMLESWGAIHMDVLRQQMNMPPLGVTPNFDKLAKEGRIYTNFYGNGQRSIQGAEAILAGMPSLPGMPFLGEGIEHNRQSFLGELAQSQGYETFFLQSSDRGSFRFDSIASRAGFSTYEGAEDIPELNGTPKPASTWGTWDHNTFQEANKLFAASHKPFLGFVFTSTTHVPWIIPDVQWRKYSGNSDHDKFLNSLYYADWALGEYIAAAKKAGYYDNTIFVLTADHTNEFIEHTEDTPNLYHVPLLIVGPGVKPGIDGRVGSQFDIVPTIADLAGWSTGYAGLGRSLLDSRRVNERVAFCVRGDVIDMIASKGWVSHNLFHRLGSASGMSMSETDELERNLLAEYQTVNRLLIGNRVVPVYAGQ